MNHDERFKALLRRFFPAVLQLIHPPYFDGIDPASLEWLDKELITPPPDRRLHLADLVVRASVRDPVGPFRPGQDPFAQVIFHLEIEANDRLTELRPRM